MKDKILFFVNNSKRFEKYKVETLTSTKKYSGSQETYEATVIKFTGVKGAKEYTLCSIETDQMPFWDSAQTDILNQITEPLNDFSSHRWEEIKNPIVEYWLSKQKASIRKQKKEGVQTVWTPAGNYPLWKFASLLTSVLIAKYIISNDDSVLEYLKKEFEGFEKDFTRLVLEPVKTYIDIEQIRKRNSDHKVMAEKIIDRIIKSSRSRTGRYQDILDPNFKDKIKFLSADEERELNALFVLYDEIKLEADKDTKLHEIERAQKVIEFGETPQGKRLNDLNSRKVYGGGMQFGEKEKSKRKRVAEIAKDLETVLISWGIEDKYVDHGLQYFQNIYEKEVYHRFLKEKSFQSMLDNSQSKFEAQKAILSGIWDDSSLNFIGILVGIAVGFGLSFASFFDSYKIIWGLGSGIVSFGVFTAIFKWNFTKKPLLKLSRWVLNSKKGK